VHRTLPRLSVVVPCHNARATLPRLSVVVPCHNARATLPRVLAALDAQHVPPATVEVRRETRDPQGRQGSPGSRRSGPSVRWRTVSTLSRRSWRLEPHEE